MSFFATLADRVNQVDSLLCIGLDPHPEDLPEFTAEAAQAFCLRLVKATKDLAAAYKPNIAFFEAFGPEGLQVLKDVIANIPESVPVILDAKRGDIASTAAAYARALFQVLGAGAVTINPYLGYDAVLPFLTNPEKGVFLLCKTSNPGAVDLQDLAVLQQGLAQSVLGPVSSSIPLYLQVAHLANDWNTSDNLGLVVGATQTESLVQVRAQAPELWILAPGVGAQGGELGAALEAGLRPDGMGMLIPVSRAISRSQNPQKTAAELRDEINHWRVQLRKVKKFYQPSGIEQGMRPVPKPFAQLADGLLQAGCIKFGSFTLKSGLESPIYIDLRRLVGYPRLLSQVAQAYIPLLEGLNFNTLAALPYAALPITSAISLLSGWPMIYPRKEVKSYGTKAQIEGVFQPGDVVVVIDDLITTGGSKFEGIDRLTAAGLVVKDIVVLIDRSPDGGEALARKGYQLHAVLTLSQLLDHYQVTGAVKSDMIQASRYFLESQEDVRGNE